MVRTVHIAALYLDVQQYETVGVAMRGFIEVTNNVLVRLSMHRDRVKNDGVGFFQTLEASENARLQETREPAIQCLKSLLTPTLPRGAVTDTDTGTR
jgi:hypothetical protein